MEGSDGHPYAGISLHGPTVAVVGLQQRDRMLETGIWPPGRFRTVSSSQSSSLIEENRYAVPASPSRTLSPYWQWHGRTGTVLRFYGERSLSDALSMNFILTQSQPLLHLKLARNRTRMLKQGYPWVYRDWLVEVPNAPRGTRAVIRDQRGDEVLGTGYFDPDSPLAVRLCAFEGQRLDDTFIRQQLGTALARRTTIASDRTNGYRMVNGEGDGLAGLVCDRYADHAVIKLDGAGPAAFWNPEAIADFLVKHGGVSSVYLKPRADQDGDGRVLCGELPEQVHFSEHGVRFRADLVHGQKTGFFFDQRENRQRIRQLARNRRVLNVFGYTGGFSVYAGVGGATQVTTVDIAKPAVSDAQYNWELNGLMGSAHQAIAADAFVFLEHARQSRERWDLIVVDPPSFASAQRHVEKAEESYARLFASALRVLEANGFIAFSSCSSHITAPMFLDICRAACSRARRRARVIAVYGQPEDHPFPLVCPELQYLKFVLLEVA